MKIEPGDLIELREPQDATAHTEEVNETTKIEERFWFSDGSMLALIAMVPVVPKSELTPRPALLIDGETMETQEGTDDGAMEDDDLARQSTAFRLFVQLSDMLGREVPQAAPAPDDQDQAGE